MSRLLGTAILPLLVSACLEPQDSPVDAGTTDVGATSTAADDTGGASPAQGSTVTGETSDGGSEETGATQPEDSETSADTSGGDGGSPPGWDPNAIPASTGPCPDLSEGWNTFCPAGITPLCRETYVRRGANTGGPLNIYWHGTYENAVDVQQWGAGAGVLATTLADDGLGFYPEADPDAINRPNQPFPWWIVGSIESDRLDDFYFMDEMVACAAESGLIDVDRINTGGMSAGGVITSSIVGRRGYFASAVSWSGGRTDPFTAPGDTSVMVIHGGPSDCSFNYCFMGPSTYFAEALDAQGVFAFLCDHSEGDTSINHHIDALGDAGGQFMSLARRGQPHPWETYPIGEDGGNWTLDNFCYRPGQQSPWAPWSG